MNKNNNKNNNWKILRNFSLDTNKNSNISWDYDVPKHILNLAMNQAMNILLNELDFIKEKLTN